MARTRTAFRSQRTTTTAGTDSSTSLAELGAAVRDSRTTRPMRSSDAWRRRWRPCPGSRSRPLAPPAIRPSIRKNELSTIPDPASDRLTAAGTLETRFFGELGKVALELRPSVRLSWTRAAIRETPLGGPTPGESSDFLPTYRVGGAISPLEWLAFRGSISSGYKLPSLLQLFGNRTNVEGNPDLVQERSLAYDAAVTLEVTAASSVATHRSARF